MPVKLGDVRRDIFEGIQTSAERSLSCSSNETRDDRVLVTGSCAAVEIVESGLLSSVVESREISGTRLGRQPQSSYSLMRVETTELALIPESDLSAAFPYT